MPSKEYRQRKIVELVEKRFISTQAEIARYLAEEEGIHVTQATVSRDVNELRLVRLPAGNGLHHYRATPLAAQEDVLGELAQRFRDRKSTRLNSSHVAISYAVFCLKKKTT